MVWTTRSVICSLSLVVASAFAQQEDALSSALKTELPKNVFNQTEFDACQEIQDLEKTSSLNTNVVFLPSTPNSEHYMISSSQASTCVYTPRNENELAAAIKIIGNRRVRFAIECSGHASNQGFSSTPGVHISMKGFQDVVVSQDNAYVDIGGGISWADVYTKLENTTVTVVGGRVPGPGIGGFITGGGGYSWLTNQYGLTGDTLISVDMVLPNGTLTHASEIQNPDLFWAIKGGGNSFGVIYSFRLRAVPRPAQVYAGTALLGSTDSDTKEFMAAIADFTANNKDPKAQIIPSANHLAGVPLNILIAYYDGIPDGDPFSIFNQTFTNQTFNSFIQSLSITNLQANQRGSFNTLSLQRYSPSVLAQIANQTTHWGTLSLLHSGTFISYDIEPFMDYSQFAQDAAWSHGNNAQPLFLYFAWTDPTKDDFWQNAMLESCRVLKETAMADGQNVDDLLLYPNYALKQNSVRAMYGDDNGERIEILRRRYDPDDVMLLTTFFRFGDQ